MTPPERKPSVAVTALLVAAGAALALGMLGQLLLLAPGLKRRFDDFGLQLPQVTKSLLALGDWLHEWWWLALPAVFTSIVVYGGVLGWFRHGTRWTALANLLAALAITGLLAGNLLVAVSLILPEFKLQEALTK